MTLTVQQRHVWLLLTHLHLYLCKDSPAINVFVCVSAIFPLYTYAVCALLFFWPPTSSVPKGQAPRWVFLCWQWWAPESKWGRITRGESNKGGPRSSALTLNNWLGLAVAICISHNNHFTSRPICTLYSLGEKFLKIYLTLSSKANRNFDVFIRGDSFPLGLLGLEEVWQIDRGQKERGQRHAMLTAFFSFQSRPLGWIYQVV